MAATYVDSSALVKLIVDEPHSAALRRHLARRGPLVSSGLARTEVNRALLPQGEEALARARVLFLRVDLVRVSEQVLLAAGTMLPASLRSLDAIHLATAQLLREDLNEVVTYDLRMADAARGLGMRVAAPG